MSLPPPIGVVELGRVPYHEAHALQRRLADRLIAHDLEHELLLLLEHERTVTLGRGTREGSLPLPVEELARRGVTVAEVERGGDVTWHGPGQLVGYPIIDLRRHRPDLHWYLRTLEQSLVETLAQFGIDAGVAAGKTGVWTGGRKIASIGVHVKQWVTLHGFALNVDPDLVWFDSIVPCGLNGVTMTSIAAELRGDVPGTAAAVQEAVIESLAAALGLVPERAVLELNGTG